MTSILQTGKNIHENLSNRLKNCRKLHKMRIFKKFYTARELIFYLDILCCTLCEAHSWWNLCMISTSYFRKHQYLYLRMTRASNKSKWIPKLVHQRKALCWVNQMAFKCLNTGPDPLVSYPTSGGSIQFCTLARQLEQRTLDWLRRAATCPMLRTQREMSPPPGGSSLMSSRIGLQLSRRSS